ncbi:hypothetical protein GF342_03325 [Candidatus Woesearchaeota archaeon]|nr:hypothetical protein [Candidatus Woesearchaeota archaeon]
MKSAVKDALLAIRERYRDAHVPFEVHSDLGAAKSGDLLWFDPDDEMLVGSRLSMVLLEPALSKSYNDGRLYEHVLRSRVDLLIDGKQRFLSYSSTAPHEVQWGVLRETFEMLKYRQARWATELNDAQLTSLQQTVTRDLDDLVSAYCRVMHHLRA